MIAVLFRQTVVVCHDQVAVDLYARAFLGKVCAKFLCTLYLQDLSDLIRGTVTEHFEIVRYGERISMSIPLFAKLEAELRQSRNPIEEEMVALLERQIEAVRPTLVGFTAPFPGNLLAILRCAQYLKERHPDIRIAMGGGYPSTELRTMTDKAIFRYIDYIILDDGRSSGCSPATTCCAPTPGTVIMRERPHR